MQLTQARSVRRIRVVVAAQNLQVVDRVVRALQVLNVPHEVVSPHFADLIRVRNRMDAVVYCLGSGAAASLPRLPGPTVVILSGLRVLDDAMALTRDGSAALIRNSQLTATSLLEAMVSVMIGADLYDVARELRSLGILARVPPQVISAFLHDPPRMRRLADLRRALGWASAERARSIVRAGGFKRAEHLFTALRCATWAILIGDGLDRGSVERYLGISDRGTFRRACVRAGVPTLHRGLARTAFTA